MEQGRFHAMNCFCARKTMLIYKKSTVVKAAHLSSIVLTGSPCVFKTITL